MIALTRGQQKRRWLTAAIMLLAMMPWWMWVGSVLVSADGEVFVSDSSAASEDCTEACCGGCTACVSALSCGSCSGDAPSEVTVTFLGVENGAACIDCTGVGNGSFKAGTGLLGTYTLAQGAFPDQCLWSFETITGPSWKQALTSDVCATPHTNSQLKINLRKTGADTFQLYAISSSDLAPGTSADGLWFYSTIDSGAPDCCVSQSFDNNLTAYGCTSRDSGGHVVLGGLLVIGINGSASITPCS